jgi:cytochrome c oxidase subunit 2
MPVEIVLAVAAMLGIPLLTAAIALTTERPPKPPKAHAVNSDTASNATWITLAIWAVLTAAGLAAVLTVDFYPTVGSDRGSEIARAFRFLTALAVPVAAMVIAVLLYSTLRRSSAGDLPPEDGAHYDGRGPFPKFWLVFTTGLTLLIIIYPGLWTLNDVIHKHKDPDLVVNVQAMQWTWLISYPDQNIENQFELVLPVDRKVTFEITSRDVIHSFWVPAFLIKIDAIPGRTSELSLIATETGDYADNDVFRVQCAELCGLSHASMRIPVRVVTQQEFDDWVSQKTAAAAAELED